jgi:hypothetical protein
MRPKPMKPAVRLTEGLGALSCDPQKRKGDQLKFGHFEAGDETTCG